MCVVVLLAKLVVKPYGSTDTSFGLPCYRLLCLLLTGLNNVMHKVCNKESARHLHMFTQISSDNVFSLFHQHMSSGCVTSPGFLHPGGSTDSSKCTCGFGAF